MAEAVHVKNRGLGTPIEAYQWPSSQKKNNDAYIKQGVAMGVKVIREALDKAGLQSKDVDCIFTTSTTGIATPTLDVRISNVVGFRSDIKRVPMFGLGCVGGMSGVARMNDYLLSHPNDVAILLSVEMCSITGFSNEGVKTSDLISLFLFGDGAAAVVGLGKERGQLLGCTGPRVMSTESLLYPDTERLMGWDVTDNGWQVVLSKDIPDFVKHEIPAIVDNFLEAAGASRSDIRTWVCHPGGPKILRNLEESFSLPTKALRLSWDNLAECGNMSSASVLHILRDTLCEEAPPSGSLGLMIALGPGFCSETVLLRW